MSDRTKPLDDAGVAALEAALALRLNGTLTMSADTARALLARLRAAEAERDRMREAVRGLRHEAAHPGGPSRHLRDAGDVMEIFANEGDWSALLLAAAPGGEGGGA